MISAVVVLGSLCLKPSRFAMSAVSCWQKIISRACFVSSFTVFFVDKAALSLLEEICLSMGTCMALLSAIEVFSPALSGVLETPGGKRLREPLSPLSACPILTVLKYSLILDLVNYYAVHGKELSFVMFLFKHVQAYLVMRRSLVCVKACVDSCLCFCVLTPLSLSPPNSSIPSPSYSQLSATG